MSNATKTIEQNDSSPQNKNRDDAPRPRTTTATNKPIDNTPNSTSKTLALTDVTILEDLDEELYIAKFKELHKRLVQEDVKAYHETQIQLPSLTKVLKPSKIAERPINYNSQLKHKTWFKVTADTNGNMLKLTTFCQQALNLLLE